MTAHFASRYWLIWAAVTFLSFLIPEVYSLVKRRPEGTLSDFIWRLERFDPSHGLTVWTAAHFLFTGIFIVLCIWLIAHFGWRLFT